MSECVKNRSFSKEEVSAILETHSLWESSARVRAVGIELPQLVLTDEEPLPAFTERELREGQWTGAVVHPGERSPRRMPWL